MRTVLIAGVSLLAIAAASAAAHAQPQTAAAHAAASQTATQPAPNADLARILADHEAYGRALDPISEGQEGDLDALGRLPDISRAHELAQAEPLQAFRDRLAAIDAATLNPADQLNHAFLSYVLAEAVDRIAHDEGRLAFDSEGGPGQWVGYMAGSTRITNRAEAEAYLSRLAAFADLYDEALVNARRGLATGFVQPRTVVESALSLARADLGFTPEADPALAPLDNLPASLSLAEQQSLRERGARIRSEILLPRRQAWATFLETEALPAAPETLGIGQRPGGADYYAFTARAYTTTDLTPRQIHDLGQAEVARIRARMNEEVAAAGWTGDFASFLEHLRTDPQYYATSREALLEKASEMAKRADGGLPALFRTLPRLTYDVRPVPEEIEATYTTGRYFPGSMAAGIPGGYIVNTGQLDQRPLYELPALTLHEAAPGHHLQIALQQEAEQGPWFRRNASVTAFTEGWGLYAEFLGEEMDFYRTPYERFGRLSYEMWRACRLVADTGIHAMGWTLEQARACFTDNSALAAHNIETELQRYISWPGQALGYKMGEIRLREIRQRAEAALGERFNVRDFHDALLVDGPLPLDLLDDRMNRWIAEQTGR